MVINSSPAMDAAGMEKPCVPQETVINNVLLAHAYVPFEKMCTTFSPLSALRKGTAFPPLAAVYMWQKGMGEMNYE